MFTFPCAHLPVLAVSVLLVLGTLGALAVLVRAVLACSCRMGVLHAVLGLNSLCRVEISVLACLCRACAALIIYHVNSQDATSLQPESPTLQLKSLPSGEAATGDDCSSANRPNAAGAAKDPEAPHTYIYICPKLGLA